MHSLQAKIAVAYLSLAVLIVGLSIVALIELGRWIAGYYFCSLGEALATISMIGINHLEAKTHTEYALEHVDHWLAVGSEKGPEGQSATEGHRKVIDALLRDPTASHTPEALRELAGVGQGVLQTMLRRGWLRTLEREVARDDDYDAPPSDFAAPRHELTPTQQGALDALCAALHSAEFSPFLLHGVTGSGKTEIYLRTIEEALHTGRTAIVLVPEISLTPQTVDAFRARLGTAVGQKYDLVRRIEANEVRLVIGARSALFAPMPSLGVIIVDEEHEASYKQGDTPRYHARDVAVMRASREGAVVVLGSATPSIETLHNAREGKYRRLELPTRVGPHASPVMTVVDMRHYARAAATAPESEAARLISPPLRAAMQSRLDAQELTVLLLNRRGFANHVMCLACEKPIECPNCSVGMVYHKAGERLACHWCGHKSPVPRECPACGAPELKVMGFGTQRIEEALAELFPAARLMRVDVDSMRRRGAFQEAWRAINRHEVDIILGTQMIAKGLHLENVTLVGVISADFALGLPDFRAAERTYQLLTQVAGRAGRGAKSGEVFVQSFLPHHYAIDCAARKAEDQFYEQELKLRRILRFPPFARLAAVIVSGEDEDLVRGEAIALGNLLKRATYREERPTVQILGPTPAPIARIEGLYRWRMLARGTNVKALHEALHIGLEEHAKVSKTSKVRIVIDIDALDLM